MYVLQEYIVICTPVSSLRVQVLSPRVSIFDYVEARTLEVEVLKTNDTRGSYPSKKMHPIMPSIDSIQNITHGKIS